ncbi:MAG: flagellar basal body L-ring protein FlgH [Tepidisphaeraceae bacterium]
MTRPLAILAVLCIASAAFGQAKSSSATAQSNDQTDRVSVDDGAPPPVPPEQRMRRNGGSLARAQLEVIVGQPEQASPRYRSSYEMSSYTATKAPEPRVLRKHDLVTVIVREQSEFKSESSSQLKKDDKLQAALNQFIQLNLANLSFDPAIGAVKPTIDVTGTRDWKGSGAVDRKDAFTTRVQAEVVDIKPNGNVILQGRTQVKQDEEESIFTISGMIRAQDIGIDNSVLSTQIYDLAIEKNTKGTVRQGTKRGWLSKFADAVWPF